MHVKKVKLTIVKSLLSIMNVIKEDLITLRIIYHYSIECTIYVILIIQTI